MARPSDTPVPAPDVLALMALAHVAGDESLGPRFLALTGMDAGDLRARAGEPDVLAAVLQFLAAHDADLMAAATALGTTPAHLAAAARTLAGDWDA
jgi:hypothetical protein